MTRTWDTEIIAVGTELLLGQIANTNAKWISEQLAIRGINTYYHTVVGDNLERLYETFKLAGERSDIVIITGDWDRQKMTCPVKLFRNCHISRLLLTRMQWIKSLNIIINSKER